MDKYLKLDVKMLKLKIYNKLIKINFKINSSSLNLFSIVWFLEFLYHCLYLITSTTSTTTHQVRDNIKFNLSLT